MRFWYIYIFFFQQFSWACLTLRPTTFNLWMKGTSVVSGLLLHYLQFPKMHVKSRTKQSAIVSWKNKAQSPAMNALSSHSLMKFVHWLIAQMTLPNLWKKEEEFETDFILTVFYHIWPFLRDVLMNRSQSITAVLISLQGCAYPL